MISLRRKPLADLTAAAAEKKLTKALSALDVTLLGLGVIIGTGIFVLTGIGAANYAGPGLMLSFVLAAITCAFVCLAYAELVAMLPVSGSAYTYTYASLGEFFGWWVGWGLVLEYSVGASAVAVRRRYREFAGYVGRVVCHSSFSTRYSRKCES